MQSVVKPFLMGGAMAVIMLAMLHRPIMSGEFEFGLGALLFGLAHVAVVIAVLAVSLILPRVRHFVRHHRPEPEHMIGMLSGVILTGSIVHLVMHGGISG